MQSDNSIPVLYIAGGGHSGSTILSIVLGISKHIFTAGEVKFYGEHTNDELEIWKYIENICMCGRKSKECPYWTVVEARAGRDLEIFHYMTFPQKIAALLDILLPFRPTKKTHAADDDQKLFEVMLDVARKDKPEVKYILDASKSVARLMHLRSHPGLDVKVIFLVRDGRAYTHSYAKAYGKGFFRWMLQWVVNNILTLRYLKKEKIDFYYLDYATLCAQPEIELQAVAHKFGFDFPDNYIERVAENEFHIRAGNPVRSRQSDFKGLVLEEKWRHEMPAWKRVTSTALLAIFNRLWLHQPD
jgi:hypothetical protein